MKKDITKLGLFFIVLILSDAFEINKLLISFIILA